ncbi:tetratricopeptide repeat protein [Desulfosarcina ovata]|uniref:protein O-GlcNAc transferase n=1 Tax=Desulfosarcina ovata subsp. ovata TaxID=2752305 RepID=A0A5K8A8G6_9BACT|nr:tetratricopeptide repeat protein [Desulfosarcina ovata]BBO88350.1 glycosyl transferase [Desulfosarcina ovata subsp. ovata]
MALSLIKEGIDENNSQCIYLEGLAHLRLGNFNQAADCLKKLTLQFPENADYHRVLGNVYKQMGKYKDAESELIEGLGYSPQCADIYYDLGTLNQIQGKFGLALKHYQSAILYNPRHPSSLNNMGLIWQISKDKEKAIEAFESAIEADPSFAISYYNLGIIRLGERNFNQAIKCFEKGIKYKPNHVSMRIGLGNAYIGIQKIEKAINNFQIAVILDKNSDKNWFNLGYAQQLNEDFKNAIFSFKKAININGNNSEATLNIGLIYKRLGRTTDALYHLEKAVQLDSNNGIALNHLIIHLLWQCQWDKIEDYHRMINQLTDAQIADRKKPTEDVFLNLIRHDNPELNHTVARAWSQYIQRENNSLKFDFNGIGNGQRKIRVGLLSANFRNHPGADLILGVLENYDRSQFEIFCYGWGNEDDKSPQKQRIVDLCDSFADISMLNDRSAAERIQHEKIQILIDLNGFIKDARVAISAYRPAPLQIRFLGLVGTTGADFFDYMIADDIVVPEQTRPYFSEKLILMPHSYLVNNYRSDNPVEIDPCSDKSQKEPFAFGCFNSAYKLDPTLFNVWLNILDTVPESVLWFMPESARVQINLRKLAKKRGLDPKRIIFLEKLPKADHLKRLSKTDLVLDTRNINGVASTTDALWVGVPVVTLAGNHFGARTSASFLSTMNIPELIVSDLAQYESLAVNLALNPQKLSLIRNKIIKMRLISPLFDTKRYVNYFENALRMVWERYLSGSAPKTMHVVQ